MMAMTYLLLSPSSTPLSSSSTTKFVHTSSPLLHIPTLPLRESKIPKRSTVAVRSKGSNSVDAPDRLISAIAYFYPFFDGVQYGKYVITQFSPFQSFIQPLVPAIRVFKSFPFNGFLVFLTLYFVVVRNPNFSRYVRFNTMQAIVLDVLLIFPDLLERTFNPRDGVGLEVMMSLDSTVFLFLLVCLLYGSSSCLLGQLPRLPIVAEAADSSICEEIRKVRALSTGEILRRTRLENNGALMEADGIDDDSSIRAAGSTEEVSGMSEVGQSAKKVVASIDLIADLECRIDAL